MKSKQILLASSSQERKRLLSMLNTPFECVSPDIDETPFPNEPPADLAYRLSLTKAKALETKNGIIIAGDQIISVDNTILGKPLNHANAVKQLQLCSRQKAISYSGVCILSSQNNFCHIEVIETHIQYRTLNDSLITAYLQYDKPYECAGSIRLEGRGHLLINSLSSTDPYAIYGLPLFSVTQALIALGFDLCDFLEKA
ncbi:MAG: Maf family nucleotide pyrophosphatase [Pseudomonadota bacterium]|nr:Maf family nucleotide pyrophosphatase [Pseudomonadota bacterium]